MLNVFFPRETLLLTRPVLKPYPFSWKMWWWEENYVCFATRSLLNPLLPPDLTTLQKLPHENENISKLWNPMAQKLVAKPRGGKVLDMPKEETEEADSKISRKRKNEWGHGCDQVLAHEGPGVKGLGSIKQRPNGFSFTLKNMLANCCYPANRSCRSVCRQGSHLETSTPVGQERWWWLRPDGSSGDTEKGDSLSYSP